MFGRVGVGSFAEGARKRGAMETVGSADSVGKEFNDGNTRGGYFEEGTNGFNTLAEVVRVGVNGDWEEFGGAFEDNGDDL